MRRCFMLLLLLAIGCSKPDSSPTTTPGISSTDPTAPAPGNAVSTSKNGWSTRIIQESPKTLSLEPIPPLPTGPAKLDLEGNPLPPYAIARLDSPHRKSEKNWELTALSADGKKFVSIELGWLLVLDALTFKPISKPVKVHNVGDLNTRSYLSFSRDCSRCAAKTSSAIVVIETSTGKQLLRRSEDSSTYSRLRISQDGKLVSYSVPGEGVPESTPRTCVVWDIDTQKEIHRFQNSYWVEFSPDKKMALTSSGQLWDLATKTVRHQLDDVANAVAFFSPDSKLLVLRDYQLWNIRVVDVATGHRKYSYGVARFSPESGDSRKQQLSFSEDSKTLRMDGTTSISWNMTTGESLGETRKLLPLPKDHRMLGQAFVGDKVVTVAANQGVLYSWDAVNGKVLSPPLAGHKSRIISVAFTPDGQEVVTESSQEIVRWKTATGEPTWKRSDSRASFVNEAAISSDGTRGFLDLQVFDLKTNQPIGKPFPQTLFGKQHFMPQFVTPDGKLIAFLSTIYERSKPLQRYWVFEVESGKLILELTLPKPELLVQIQPTPDGSKIVVYQYLSESQGIVEIFDAKTGALRTTIQDPSLGDIRKFRMLDNSRAIVTKYTPWKGLSTPDHGKLQIVNLETGQIEKTLQQADSLTYSSLAMSPDRKRVATLANNSGYRLLQIFELETGKSLFRVPMHTITAGEYTRYDGTTAFREFLTFSPDGKRLTMLETNLTAIVLELPELK